MEKKRGHLQIGEPTHIVGLAFVISMVLLLWLSHDVRADILPGGTVRTSYLKANGYSGKNLDGSHRMRRREYGGLCKKTCLQTSVS